MDADEQAILNRGREETIKLENDSWPYLKDLAITSQVCMANCYTDKESVSECHECALDCNGNKRHLESEIRQKIAVTRKAFSDCVVACRFDYNPQDIKYKDCLNVCSTNLTSEFVDLRKFTKELFMKIQK